MYEPEKACILAYLRQWLINHPFDQFDENECHTGFNPYSFSTIWGILRPWNFQRSPEIMRREIVFYLENNPFDNDFFLLELYKKIPFSESFCNVSVHSGFLH